ncbi:MAG: aldehyde dehydrogenase [Bauldia sp.]|nr:aldehyde dehydrogenase [Bauldia sp.]
MPAAAGGRLPVLNPVDGATVVAEVPEMGGGDVAGAVGAAVEGYREWRRVAGPDRGEILLKAANLLRARTDDIAADLVAEMGKTMGEARGEVARSADFFEYFAAFGRLSAGDVLPDRRAELTMTLREPVGVVLAITPWNDPLLTPARKLAPALISGNAVILKAATETPLVGLHLARALHDAGLPGGAIGTVTGRGSVVGPELLRDERIDAVTFTGSTETGHEVKRSLADRNIRVQNEMGGKNAAVVMADADLPAAIATIAGAAFGQGGQRCTATSRLLVAADIIDDVLERLVAACGAIRVGPGTDPETAMGPMVSRGHQQSVLAAIAAARDEGAKILCGGGAPNGALAAGCFVEPTVVANVEPSMAIWREEVFGPVLAVRPFDALEEAIDDVNNSEYGLSSAIFTQNLGAAHRFFSEVETGQVSVNLSTSGWDVHIPFGGFRESGSAFKEQGAEAIRFFTRVKTVSIGH